MSNEQIIVVKRLNDQKPAAWGLWLDAALLLSVAAAALVSAAALALSRVVPVGWWLVLAAFGAVLVTSTILTSMTVWFPPIGLKAVRLVWWVRNLVAGSPDLRGDLLDGLWLPRNLRLASWAMLVLLLAIGGLVAGRWAPPTLRQQKLSVLEAIVKNPRDPFDRKAAQDEIDRSSGEQPRGGVNVRRGAPNAVSPADKLPSDRTPAVTTTQRAGQSTTTPAGTQPPIVVYYDPEDDARRRGGGLGTGPTRTETVVLSSERSGGGGNLWFRGLSGWEAVPLALMNPLLSFGFGFGDPEEHRLRVVTVTQRVVEQQELTEAELDLLMAGVLPEKAVEFGNELKKIIAERQAANPDLLAKNQQAIDAAVDRYKNKQPPIDPDKRAAFYSNMIVEMGKRSPPATADDVFRALVDALRGGKFDSPEARRAVIDLARQQLDATLFAGYEKKINEIN